MLRRAPFFIAAIFLLLATACAPRQAIKNVTSAATQLAPVAQQVLNAIASASVSPSRSGTPAAPEGAAPQIAASTLVTLNGAPLALTLTAHENIYVAPGTPSAFFQSVIADASTAAQRLMQDEGWSGAPAVTIFLFPSRAVWLQGIEQIGGLPQSQVQFQAQLKGDAWVTISGAGHPGIYIYPIQQSSFDMLHMLAHEYTHAIQRQVITDNTFVPDWFIEGMAEAEGWRIAGLTDPRAYAQVHAQTVAFVRAAMRQRRLIPLNGISTQQAWQVHMESPRSATLEYGEGQLAIEYLQRISGANAPMRILQATAAQHNFQAAFQQIAGETIPKFQAGLEASLR